VRSRDLLLQLLMPCSEMNSSSVVIIGLSSDGFMAIHLAKRKVAFDTCILCISKTLVEIKIVVVRAMSRITM